MKWSSAESDCLQQFQKTKVIELPSLVLSVATDQRLCSSCFLGSGKVIEPTGDRLEIAV